MKEMIKKLLLTITIVCGFITLAFLQAKKPTIMVVPSDLWCITNGYIFEYDNQGTKVKIPNYKKAVQESADLMMVISKINEMMAERGFPLKNLESSLKTLESESADNAMLTSKSGGAVAESPIDKLRGVAKADIWMQVTWIVNQVGPKRSVTFNLQGLDAYTDKQIAGASGTGNQSFTVELPILLQEAVLAHLDNFNAQLQTHFNDMFENGREITGRIKKFDSWDADIEKEFGGKELGASI